MNIFSYIKQHLSIVSVIQEYVTLKKAGGYLKGPCPFHDEKDASFTVSPHKEIFYCFGCHVSGDVISFISQIEGCNQMEAAQLLIDKYNLEIPAHLHNNKTFISTEQKNHYFELCYTCAKWFTQQLQHSYEAQEYIKQRHIDTTALDVFSIGFFPVGQTSIKQLQHFVQKEGFLIKDLLDAGIVMESKHGLYSPYENRIIFPITDHLGRYCGFGGRVFIKDDDRAKYYNSRENEYFNKGTLLFGMHQAKKDIQIKEAAFLVEGYTDCIAMFQYGYKNTVATLGTACTYEHLKQLSHYADYLYVIFDGDKAGLNAMLKLTQLCWNVSIETRVIVLPASEDPASFLRKNHTLDTYIQHAQDIFSFFVKQSCTHYQSQSLKKKLVIVQEIIKIIASINDHLKQTVLLQEASSALGVPFEILKRECRNHNTYITHGENEQKTIAEQSYQPSPGDQKMFSLIMHHPELMHNQNYSLIVDVLPLPLCQIIHKRDQYIARTPTEKTPPFDEILHLLDNEEKSLIHHALMADMPTHTPNIDHEMCEFIKYHWKTITHTIKQRIAHAQQENNVERVTQLLTQLQKLKQKILKLEL
jgi:DNA primase